MNEEAFKQVRERIAQPEAQINMNEWARLPNGWNASLVEDVKWALGECGSVGCIAGYTVSISPRINLDWSVSANAAKFLGLNTAEAEYVFYGCWARDWRWLISKEKVLAYLDAVIASGRVFLYEKEDGSYAPVVGDPYYGA